ncbi:MAG TPA: DHH family phosphoesterase, partial [Aquificae bacterium]|nr:DHH family phosphoesterase [Aquificota bacterium]
MLLPTKDKVIISFVDKFLKILKNSKKILVTGHKNPDGDAIGSGLGLYIFLRKLF